MVCPCRYAFSDEGEKVKVYIDLAGVGELADDAFKLNWGVTTLTLLVSGLQGSNHKLQFKHLCGTIKGAKLRKKANKIILTLEKKEKDTTWCVAGLLVSSMNAKLVKRCESQTTNELIISLC